MTSNTKPPTETVEVVAKEVDAAGGMRFVLTLAKTAVLVAVLAVSSATLLVVVRSRSSKMLQVRSAEPST